jgi:hypothetical protein
MKRSRNLCRDAVIHRLEDKARLTDSVAVSGCSIFRAIDRQASLGDRRRKNRCRVVTEKETHSVIQRPTVILVFRKAISNKEMPLYKE